MKKHSVVWQFLFISIIVFYGCDITGTHTQETSQNEEYTDVSQQNNSEGYGEVYLGTGRATRFYSRKLIVLILDGASNKGTIKTRVVEQLKNSGAPAGNFGVSYSYNWYYYTSPQSFTGMINRINNACEYFGTSKSNIRLVLVGKSYGGARLYKFVYKKYDFLNQFYLIGVTYVDAHEPGCPADSGKCNYWYDWVIFRGDSDCEQGDGRYHHWDLYRNVFSGSHLSYKYRQYNVYQRLDNIRGYAFTRLGDRNHRLYGSTDHFNIVSRTTTKNQIYNAISFALGLHHNPY